MEFITILNGVVTGNHDGDINADLFGTPYYGHERVPLPAGVNPPRQFDRVEFYGDAWQRKSDSQLVAEGLMDMPAGYIFEGQAIRKMSSDERILAGLDAPPAGQKIVDGVIVPMTMRERLAAGQITQTEYGAWASGENEAEYDRRLAALMSNEAMARAELETVYATQRTAALTALLAVKQQQNWPLSPVWPD
jgi:hypothetical protein